MGIVSTGQYTIVDQNDMKPITAIITGDRIAQQSYSKDNGTVIFVPDYTVNNLILTAHVYVGGVDVTAGTTVTGKKWSTTFDGTSVGSGVTYTINTNLTSPDTTPAVTYYFTCTYTDPVSGLASRVDCSFTVSVVTKGSNAVYVQTSGTQVIVQSDTATKNVAVIKAELFRTSGIDSDNLKYKWYSINTAGVATQIYNGNATVGTSPAVPYYGIKSTAAGATPTGTASDLGNATFTTAGVGSNSSWTTPGSPGYNTLVIGEPAINNYGLFKVEVQDTAAENAGNTYTAYFTVYDVSDKYRVEIYSTAGDKLLRGVGNSSLWPKTYNGSTELASYAGWTFDWYCRDKNGAQVGFVDCGAGTTPLLTRSISANSTTGLTLGSAASLNAGDLVKMVSADGATVKFAEVQATTTTSVSFQSATGNNVGLSTVTGLTSGEFANGTMYKAVAKKTSTGSGTLASSAAISVTEYDIDGKNSFFVDANRPG